MGMVSRFYSYDMIKDIILWDISSTCTQDMAIGQGNDSCACRCVATLWQDFTEDPLIINWYKMVQVPFLKYGSSMFIMLFFQNPKFFHASA